MLVVLNEWSKSLKYRRDPTFTTKVEVRPWGSKRPDQSILMISPCRDKVGIFSGK